MRVVLGKFVQHSHIGRNHPSVAAGPVALLAVRGGVGRAEVLVAPPQPVFGVPEPFAGPVVHLPGLLEIVFVAAGHSPLHKSGHTHLDGVDPGPVGDGFLPVEDVVQALFDVLDHFLLSEHTVHIDVALGAAVIVGIGRECHSVAHIPVELVSPVEGVVYVLLLRVHAVECEQAFVVHASCPDVALVNLAS